jgi:hypothetical protein
MLRVLTSSTVAKSIFAEQATKLDLDLFLQMGRDKVRDLEHLDFEASEVDNFERIMVAESTKLYNNGHVNFERKEISLKMLTSDISARLRPHRHLAA